MSKKASLILLSILAVSFMLFNYGEMLFSANDLMFTIGRDGMKNYYTYSYHIVNDASYFNFDGMNYPYGDNVFFSDCHPLLANILKVFGNNFDLVHDYNVGILNVILLASIFIMFFVCYYLLIEFGVSNTLAAIFAVGMTLLSPQISRLYGGHLALSYSFAIPLNVLWLLRYLKNEKRHILLLYIFGINIVWLFTHAYLGVICILFSLLICLMTFVLNKRSLQNFLTVLKPVLALVIPIILFLVISKATDSHSNRTDNPSGFFNYNAELDDVLVPHHPPLRPFLDQLTNNKIKLKQEAWSYIGLFSVFVLFYLVALLVKKGITKKTSPLLDELGNNKSLVYGLLASLVLLLFAFAIPFRTFPVLLDYIPFIKQFRSTGRFTWPFHFMMLITSSLVVQYVFEQTKHQRKLAGLLVVVGFAGLNIIEGLPYHTEVARLLSNQNNWFLMKNLPDHYIEAIKNIRPSDYQSLMTLPYYFQGAESYSRPAKDIPLEASMVMAYHTKLPLINTNLGRTSIWENKNLVQLISPNFYEKAVEKDFVSDKPILVIKSKDKLTESESYIFDQCKLVYKGEKFSLYSLPVAELFTNNSSLYYEKYKSSQLFDQGDFEVTDSLGFVYYNSFESIKSEKVFRGKGGVQSVKKVENVLVEFEKNTFTKNNNYHLSVWMNNEEQDALNLWFRLMLQFYDESDRRWKDFKTVFPERAETINENWSLVEMNFRMATPSNKYRLLTVGKENSKANLFVDDLLIRETGLNVFRYDSVKQELFYNNHQINLVK